MAYTNQISAATSFKYIVTGTLPGPFHTIQDCIDYVQSQGETATILIRPGLYVEDLTLYSEINLQGSDEGGIIIAGVHTPPPAGSFVISNCTLASNTDIFNSAAAGTSAITVETCSFELLNGVVFRLVNWTGPLSIYRCSESDGSKSNNIASTGTNLEITDSAIGLGDNPMSISGITEIFNSTLSCPIINGLTGVLTIDGGSVINGAITNVNDAYIFIYNSRISSGDSSALWHSGTGLAALANVVIDSSNVAALDGTGTISIGEVVYKDSTGVAVTLVYNNATELHCSNLLANQSMEVRLGDMTITDGQLVLGISGGTSGQIPIAATGANPAWATLTSPTGTVTFTPGVNTLGIDATSGLTWSDATADFTLAVGNGYNVNHATPANEMLCTLPATATIGQRIEIVGSTAGGWKVVQNANQYIRLGNQVSVTGAAGYIEFTNQYDSVELTCIVAGASTGWRVTKAVGNITVA